MSDTPLTATQRRDVLYAKIDKAYAELSPVGVPEIDERLGRLLDIKVKTKLAWARTKALNQLMVGQTQQIKDTVRPWWKSAYEIASAYDAWIVALRDQNYRNADRIFAAEKSYKEYTATEWAQTASVWALALVTGIYVLPASAIGIWATIKGAAYATQWGLIWKGFSKWSASSLANSIEDWYAKPLPIVDSSGQTEEQFSKAYAAKVAELQNSPDKNLRALGSKLEAAYKGEEIGPIAWVKRNWTWLTIGSIVAIIVLNPVKNRG